MEIEWPAFIRGCFLWEGLGYSYAEDPPPGLLDDAALMDKNPWMVLAAVLERAKRGDFESLPLLLQCMRASNSGVLRSASVIILGQAAPARVLRQVLSEFDDEIRANNSKTIEPVSSILYESLSLWTVPILLDLYYRAGARREETIIPQLLSRLLEKEKGPIYKASLHEELYREAVLERCSNLATTFGTDQVAVLYGDLFSVDSLAKRLLKTLTGDPMKMGMVMGERGIFEAATGIECSSFYRDTHLQPLAAAEIIEAFLESGEAERFKPGVRYFFGHRIPD